MAVLGGDDSEQDPLILMAQGLDGGREHTMRAGRPRPDEACTFQASVYDIKVLGH